jgi:hypothetical protein
LYRYYLTEEREVTKEEFVSAERRAGFVNTMGQRDEPATTSFSGRAGDTEISGRTVYIPESWPTERHPPGADAGPNYGEAAYLDDEIGGMT